MREVLPSASIVTECLERDDKHAVFKAVISNGGNVLAVAHGSETMGDFKDFLEKAETKAIGRALAMCGFGTQFTAGELDEGERIVDSPVSQKQEELPIMTLATPDQIRELKMLTDLEQQDKLKQKYGIQSFAELSAATMERLITKLQSRNGAA